MSEPEFARQHLSVEELDALIWTRADQSWEPLAERELFALERLVSILVGQAEAGGFGNLRLRSVANFAAAAGLELRSVEVESEGQTELLWLLLDAEAAPRGRGAYLIRLGPVAESKSRAPEGLLQAPHSRYDKHTGEIALRLFLTGVEGSARPRALFVNTFHRYTQADGTRTRRDDASRNPADAAHREDHPFARATAQTLHDHDLFVVQLHGFGRQAEAGDPDVIVGSGGLAPHAFSSAVFAALRAAFPEFSMAEYGTDTDRLGGTTNVQGQAARDANRCFVHIETSEAVRDQLRDDRDSRRNFARAVLGASEVIKRGCR